MYTQRVEANIDHINRLNEGSNEIENDIKKISQEVKNICTSIDILDKNRKIAVERNYDMRKQYIGLQKEHMLAKDLSVSLTSDISNLKPIYKIIRDASICSICLENIGLEVRSCVDCIGIVCKHCTERLKIVRFVVLTKHL